MIFCIIHTRKSPDVFSGLHYAPNSLDPTGGAYDAPPDQPGRMGRRTTPHCPFPLDSFGVSAPNSPRIAPVLEMEARRPCGVTERLRFAYDTR